MARAAPVYTAAQIRHALEAPCDSCRSLSSALCCPWFSRRGWLLPAPRPRRRRRPCPPPTKPVTLSATIEAIDKSTRMITLKGPQGNLATVYADSSVKRFEGAEGRRHGQGDLLRVDRRERARARRPGATRVVSGRLPQPDASRCHRFGAGDGDGHRHLGGSSPIARSRSSARTARSSACASRTRSTWTWQSPAPRWTSPIRRRC